jgi:hypothetical protein
MALEKAQDLRLLRKLNQEFPVPFEVMKPLWDRRT